MSNLAKLLIGCIALTLIWWYFTPKPAPAGTTVIAKPAPKLRGRSQLNLTPPTIKAYAPLAKKVLGLPADVQDDPNKYVLGSARLSSDTHPHNFTTVIDAKTGEMQMYDTRQPLPWLAAEQHGEIRIDYGIKNAGVKVGRISLREELLQVKELHAGINAAVDTDGSIFMGAGVGYRW